MNKISILTGLLSTLLFYSQNNNVERSIFNIQTGFIGVWINNELKLSNNTVLRTETGLEPRLFVGNGTYWSPIFRLEPRYYYNISKRENNGLRIKNNSANFLAIALNYRPAKSLFSQNNIEGVESYSIVPKWGMRRNFSKNLNYECGVGFGFRHETDYGNFGEIDIHLRIGYTF